MVSKESKHHAWNPWNGFCRLESRRKHAEIDENHVIGTLSFFFKAVHAKLNT